MNIVKNITKKHRIAIMLVVSLLLLVAVTVPLVVHYYHSAPETEYGPQPEILEGEARQDGLTLAYPTISDSKLVDIVSLERGGEEFGFVRLDGESHLTMYYIDSDGKQQIYYPRICEEDEGFDYTDLFVSKDAYGMGEYSLVDYLLVGLRMPYFGERIAISEDEAVREKQLKEYGFTADNICKVSLAFRDEFGNTDYHVINIGARCVTGTGYYFTVDDRAYIYNSTNNYYDYAVSELTEFIKPLLVSDGLDEDKGFGPLLTTGYYQWLNEVHKTEGETVMADSKVIAYTDIISATVSDDSSSSGYTSTGFDLVEIDLSKYKNLDRYERMLNAIIGKKNGVQDENIVFTLTSVSNRIDFGDRTSVRYEYEISAIEAILTEDGEITAEGSVAGEGSNLIKVTYTSRREGIATAKHKRHAVIDLTSASIPADAVAKLRTAPIGELADKISFAIDYTKENATRVNGKYVITEIISIYNQKGESVDKVAEDSIVGYRYSVLSGDEVVAEETFILNLKEVEDEGDIEIKNKLLGREISRELDIVFEEQTAYYECFQSFTTYKISRIDYFVTGRIISAFRFQNSSSRDPYYGESLYENLMEDEHKLYGLNSSACEAVAKMLGGLSEKTTTATADGLKGLRVLEIGITPEIMEKYGLYAHTVYFELPRGIYTYTPESSHEDESVDEQLDDYGYYDKLGFTLYISDVDPVTNTRVVASDMYNVVVEANADDYVFLNYDFESFWARRQLILMDIKDIEALTLELHMSDLKGSFEFDLNHKPTQYQTANGGIGEFNKITVKVTPRGECTSNRLIEYMKSKGYDTTSGFVSLTELYDSIYPDLLDDAHKAVYPDSLGTAYFKEAIRMLYLTAYVDVMPEEDRAAAKSPDKLVMRMRLDITSSAFQYVYEFYRADDRRILVSIHKEDANGSIATTPVADFYVSTFAFKKVVTNFWGILNGELIEPDLPYGTDEEEN